ncbi:MAG: hypothetical protein ACHQYR_03495 [Candidatus Gagatemarchaeaceae archaeon]
MKRLVASALLLLLVLTLVSGSVSVHAQAGASVTVRSQYTLNRYGFATINETVTVRNSGSSAASAPTLTFGFGNLTSEIAAYNLVGSTFVSPPGSPSGPFSVNGNTAQAGGNSSYVLSLLLNGVVTTAKNGSLRVLTLSTPILSAAVDRLVEVVQMPSSTTLKVAPLGLQGAFNGANDTYSAVLTNAQPTVAVTSVRYVLSSTAADFNPLKVYSASRTITVGHDGNPLVTDEVEFRNLGTSTLTGLFISPLAAATIRVTVLTESEPRLLSPVTIPLNNGAIDLSLISVGYPSSGVPAGTNYTLSYQYAASAKYYSNSGGQVTLTLPETPPIKAFADFYSIVVSAPVGVKVTQAGPSQMSNVSPWQGGTATVGYSVTPGWGIDSAIPGASIVFVLLLLGLFVSRVTLTEEEETEEESASVLASAMINAFEEKTNLINGLWPEISSKDPNELNKAYFDELRGRLDAFRGRAMQRLNELRQKATTQRFSELLNQIQASEREVERAAKDKLNLYDQYYLNRMRKEVYERLLPQYTKRLEKALNQLSDELHLVQREAKVL